MKKVFKLSLYDFSRIVIENYQQLIMISNDNIVIDNYLIFGENLKIVQMDEYILELTGQIHRIDNGSISH